MRKPRAIVIDDDQIILDVFKTYLEERGYDVVPFSEPDRCPIYRNISQCGNVRPCSDIMLLDYWMPKMSGVDLLEAQVHMGCRLTIKNKALISGYLDQRAMAAVRRLGCASFGKPPVFEEFNAWLDQCEQRMDLTQPLGMPRKDQRVVCAADVACQVKVDHEVYQAKALNHSSSGLCLRTEKPLIREQIVTLLTELPLESYRAIVRWTRQSVNNGFLAGMSCC